MWLLHFYIRKRYVLLLRKSGWKKERIAVGVKGSERFCSGISGSPSRVSCLSCLGSYQPVTRKVLSVAEILRNTRSENQSVVSHSAWWKCSHFQVPNLWVGYTVSKHKKYIIIESPTVWVSALQQLTLPVCMQKAPVRNRSGRQNTLF